MGLWPIPSQVQRARRLINLPRPSYQDRDSRSSVGEKFFQPLTRRVPMPQVDYSHIPKNESENLRNRKGKEKSKPVRKVKIFTSIPDTFGWDSFEEKINEFMTGKENFLPLLSRLRLSQFCRRKVLSQLKINGGLQ